MLPAALSASPNSTAALLVAWMLFWVVWFVMDAFLGAGWTGSVVPGRSARTCRPGGVQRRPGRQQGEQRGGHRPGRGGGVAERLHRSGADRVLHPAARHQVEGPAG